MRIDRQWKVRRALIAVIWNFLPLLVILYGIKCAIFLHGSIFWHEPLTPRWSFHMVSLSGQRAVMTGFGYIALGVFGLLSVGSPPDEDRAGYLRVARWIIRWGSLVIGFWLWQKVYSAGK